MESSDIKYIYENRNLGLRIAKHFLFWMLFVFYNVATWGAYNDDINQPIFSELCYLPAKILFTYFTMYYLIPKLLLSKKYLLFSVWFLVGLLLTGLLNRWVTYFIIYPAYIPEAVGSGFWKIKIFFEITIIVNIASLGAAIKLVQFWHNNEQSRKKLAQEKLEAELQLLKSQIHPHFLFNTLNNLYALTLEKSSLAPDMVLKLSSLLNYMLYECNIPLVPLEKEIEYITNYVSLEKLRYGQRLDLSFEVSGAVQQKLIAPLILLPFVENSFKHGVSQEADNPWIHLNLWVNGDVLQLQIENNMEESDLNWAKNNSDEAVGYTKGIGLKNVKRRLDLLYKDRYELKIRKEESFLVILKLQLAH